MCVFACLCACCCMEIKTLLIETNSNLSDVRCTDQWVHMRIQCVVPSVCLTFCCWLQVCVWTACVEADRSTRGGSMLRTARISSLRAACLRREHVSSPTQRTLIPSDLVFSLYLRPLCSSPVLFALLLSLSSSLFLSPSDP